MKKNSRRKKGNKLKQILYLTFLIIFSIINASFIINIIKLKEIENLIRIIVCIILGILNIYFILRFFLYKVKGKKLKINLHVIIMILLSLIIGFLNFNLNKIYSVLDNVSQNYEEYTLSLVTLSDNNISNIKQIDDNIAVIEDENITNGYTFAKEIIKKNNINYELVKYEDYISIVKDLYEGKIKYAFLPDNYVLMFSQIEEYEDIDSKLKVIHTDKVEVEVQSVSKNAKEPFTILLMGVDTLTSSFNADTLLVVTFNPETLTATMLSIPRDTYTRIACTGGKHKINSSGWYSDKCVVDTVSNLLNVKIDYYAKMNFRGVVDLVNALGGIEVDVVYPFCEQNSKRQFGKKMIYVEKGLQTLNGEQALALTRNRKYHEGKCPAKYTTEGYYSNNIRNDITRGLNQQLVVKGILNKLSNINDLNTIYKLLDTIGKNITTNMDEETMLSFYNVFKNIVLKSNFKSIDDTLTIQKLSLEVYGARVNISKMNLSMIIAHQNSINAVSNAMKENLGLKERDVIKTLKFNINKPYKETIIGDNIYGGTTLNLMDNMVGKTRTKAESYCNKNGLNCEFKYVEKTSGTNDKILSQSVPENYDLAVLGSKKITFEVAKVTVQAPVSFDYSNCMLAEFQTDSRCILPDFTSKNISNFNSWYQNFGYIEVNKVSVSDTSKTNDIVVSQTPVNKSVYEIFTNNIVIKIEYVKNAEPPKEEEKPEVVPEPTPEETPSDPAPSETE